MKDRERKMDIKAYDNEMFAISLNVSAFTTVYELDGAAWEMQVRRTAATAKVDLELSTVNGRALYSEGVVSFWEDSAVMRKLSGDYVWDFIMIPADRDVVRCEGGKLTIVQGVTR